jgi:Co/Zn/Cd efflux system component
MSAGCSGGGCSTAQPFNDPRWRRVLWFALIINATMFTVEIVAGVGADSRALQADAIDFLGDAGNYAVSLTVASMALVWRARASLLKAATMLAFGLGVLAATLWSIISGAFPHAETMGIVGALALLANVGVALMLFRYRTGDSNMRSVWICSRNDAIGNVAVLLAALGVVGTGTAWPDLIIAGIMASLAVSGSWSVFRQARAELSHTAEPIHG